MHNIQQCTVTPFLSEHPEQTGATIVAGATDFDTKNRKNYFIVFDQVIWFGNQIRK